MKQFCYISQRRSILFYFIFFLSYKTNSVNLFPKEEIKKQKPSKPFPFIFFFDKSFRKFRNNKRFIFCFALKKEYLQIIININMHNNRTIIRKEIPGEYFFRWNQRWSRNRDSGRFSKYTSAPRERAYYTRYLDLCSFRYAIIDARRGQSECLTRNSAPSRLVYNETFV